MGEKKDWKYCVVGNIVKERTDENGVLRHGTVAFRGGTRVYLEGKNHHYAHDSICVIGKNRFGRYEYTNILRDQVENVRFSKVYKPSVVTKMYDYEEYDWWGNTEEDGLDAKQFAAAWPNFPEYREDQPDDACE